MGKHLILIGGGHAHMETLLHLEEFTHRGNRVTVVSAADYQYYSGMGPGLLGGFYRPPEARFHIRKMAEDRGGVFLQEKVIGLDPEHRRLTLSSGRKLAYDLASFSIGSEVKTGSLDIRCNRVLPVKPIGNLFLARQLLLTSATATDRPQLLIAGGGPSGVEIAGNLRRLQPAARITLIAGRPLLSGLPRPLADRARRSLTQRHIAFREGAKVLSLIKQSALLDDGSSIFYDLAFLAVGLKPPPIFNAAGTATGRNGGLLVNPFLQSVTHPELFGGGDCIDFQPRELAKIGVYAVREGPLLSRNLQAAVTGSELRAFKPQKKYLLILNLGDGNGLLGRGRWVWHSRLAFLLKDRIDRKFMKRYQLSGEAAEPITADPLLREQLLSSKSR
jgi:NADH dehydrogenase FAD-containing subunit